MNYDDDKEKFKPDYLAFVTTRSTKHDFTIAEIKPPRTISGKPPSDLVKINQQIKVMLKNLVRHKVASPVVGGILFEGK